MSVSRRGSLAVLSDFPRRRHRFCSLLCWQMYAAKGLRKESMKVWTALRSQDVEGARYAVSMIVGRDTSVLDEKGILKAALRR